MITVKMVRDKGFEFVGDDLVRSHVGGGFQVINSAEAALLNSSGHFSSIEVGEFAWRESKGEMPCDGELLVDVEISGDKKVTEKVTDMASKFDWVIARMMEGDFKWRPSLENWKSEKIESGESEVKNLADKVETPEEKEAFEGMANSSKIPNGSECDGEWLPQAGIECEVRFTLDTLPKWYKCTIDYSCCDVGVLDIEGEKCAFTTSPSNGHSVEFRKPETPQQREERENLELAYELYCSGGKGIDCEVISLDGFIASKMCSAMYLAIAKRAKELLVK